MAVSSVPPLFKYFGHGPNPLENGGLKVLQNLALKVTPPVKFNDPFEFTPILKCIPAQDDAKQQLKQVLSDRRFFESNRAEFPRCRNFSEFQRHIRAKMGELVPALAASTERMNYCFQQDVLPTLSKTHGVICFSATPDHPLIWAHYAAAHTGLVLEFDHKCPLFEDKGFLQVDYQPTRAEFDPDLPDRLQIEVLARRKSSDWSYEREYRLIVAFSRTKGTMVNGSKRFLLPIPPEWLKSVTVGLRASFELKAEVMRLRRTPELSHLALYRISMNQNAFAFDRNEVRHF